jgi:hypothetical protein
MAYLDISLQILSSSPLTELANHFSERSAYFSSQNPESILCASRNVVFALSDGMCSFFEVFRRIPPFDSRGTHPKNLMIVFFFLKALPYPHSIHRPPARLMVYVLLKAEALKILRKIWKTLTKLVYFVIRSPNSAIASARSGNLFFK